MMGLYEVMIILRADLETEEHEEVLNGLKNTISENGGTVDKLVDWRRRRLAYEVDKNTEGQYYLVYFKGHGAIIPELEHFFKVTDAVIRFLFVRAEEDYYESAAAQEPEVDLSSESDGSAEQDEFVEASVGADQDTVKEAAADVSAAEPADTETTEEVQSSEEAGKE